MAVSYKVFGVHDWAARIPVALSAIALCWLTAAFGIWAFGKRAGFYAGLCMATCVGLWLFTRVLIPDVMLTATIALAMWALLRVLDDEEPHPRAWAYVLAASLGTGLLLKSLIGVVFPVAAGLIYLALTRQLVRGANVEAPAPVLGDADHSADRRSLARAGDVAQSALLRLHDAQRSRGVPRLPVVFLHQRAIAALPELALSARLQHRPADLLLALSPGVAVSLERVLPRDFQVAVQAGRSSRKNPTAGALLDRVHPGVLHLLDHARVLLDAVLSGDGIVAGLGHRWQAGSGSARGTRALTVVTGACAAVAITILVVVRNVPVVGDISSALSQHPGAYTLSLGHMEDLTLRSFAYLRLPLAMAALALCVGFAGTLAKAQSVGGHLARH